jgi:hypothetical protein
MAGIKLVSPDKSLRKLDQSLKGIKGRNGDWGLMVPDSGNLRHKRRNNKKAKIRYPDGG